MALAVQIKLWSKTSFRLSYKVTHCNINCRLNSFFSVVKY